jgi:hypothetical protein
MPAIASTSVRLHSEFVRLLFLQAHRETDRFFAASGVQLAQYNCASSTTTVWRSPYSFDRKCEHSRSGCRTTDYFEYIRRTFNVTITHSPIALENLSLINLSIFRYSSPPRNTVYSRRVDLSALAFSLSSHQHSYVSLLYSSRFIVSK